MDNAIASACSSKSKLPASTLYSVEGDVKIEPGFRDGFRIRAVVRDVCCQTSPWSFLHRGKTPASFRLHKDILTVDNSDT
jgi:hypothetical protein